MAGRSDPLRDYPEAQCLRGHRGDYRGAHDLHSRSCRVERNWDYRFCWLRDAYFVVNALNRLGATHTMERYLNYILNIVAEGADRPLSPVYTVTGHSLPPERIVESLPGYRGFGPVRVSNQAAEQAQHDVYGSS